MPHAFFSALLAAALVLLPQFQAKEPLTETEAFVQNMTALASDGSLILFKAGTFDPVQGVPEDAGFVVSSFRDRDAGDILYVVQFRSTPGEVERAVIEREGGTILHYIPNNAYLVRLPSARFSRLFGATQVRAAFRLPKFAKLDPDLTDDLARDRKVELVAPSREDLTALAGLLAKRFPALRFISETYHHRQGRVIVEAPAQTMRAFLDYAAGLEDVLSILAWQEKQLLNDNSVWVIQNYDTTNTTNYALSATLWNHGITGTGQITCVNDSGATNTMCYFRYNGTAGSEATAQNLTPPDTGTVDLTKKTVAYYVEPGAAAYDNASFSYHGTHTCGSVLGDNYATLSSPTSGGHDSGDGMAPNAKLVMQDVGDASGGLSGLAGDLDLMFLQAYNAGARIHSDSWGTESSNYDSTAMDMDEFMYRHEDFLFVVAMGNSGLAPGDGTIGSPATAKSIVSVGGATNGGSASQANNLTTYSRGPVDDGRRKPDVCTPAYTINSANGGASCSPTTMSGTSMATPTTAGGLTLLRQYFTDGWYPSGTKTAADARIPSGALMKACLVNGAMEMTGTDPRGGATITRIPSMDQGWGRTHLENGLYFSGDTRRLRVWDIRNANGLTTGQQAEYTVNVPANTQPLKVHLVWTDPESTTLAATNLVNNLDLEVVAPGGAVYRGNVFSAGQSTTGGSADVLNPVEGAVFTSPATGDWTLRVKATAVPGAATAPYSNRQGYALVATYASCASSLAAPTGLTTTNNGTTGIDLSWNTVSGASAYIVYKAVGTSPAPGDYSVLVQQAGTAFTDTKVQGGYTYWYKVRATDNCSESPLSSAASAGYTGNCTMYPTFDGIGSVTNDLGSVVCDLVLAWPAATSNCPLGPSIHYNIYRGTTPYFTLDGTSLLASDVVGTTFTDYSVNALSTYYYVVRAEDSTTLNGGPSNGGNQDTNTKMLKGTPWASTTAPGTYSDDGGDTAAKLFTNGVWRVSNRQNHTPGGTFAYYNSLDGSAYKAGICNDVRTPPLPLQAGAQLSYWVRYNVEYQWDGVVVEISTNGGSSWTILTPSPAYPGDFSTGGGVTSPINACNYALTQACFNGPSGNAALTAWTQYTHDLSSYSGQTAILRWNFSSDGGAEFEGFYLDDIAITNASVYEGCATRDGIVSLDAASYACSLDTIGIQLADYDLRGAGTHQVTITSTSEPAGETMTLTEAPANSGAFSGSILTTATAPPSAGQLSVAHGDTITVTYIDADDGHGGINVTKTDTAAADCVGPVISNVLVTNITVNSATVTWTTNEAANSRVTYGLSTPPGTNQDDLGAFVTSHSVNLSGLAMCTPYYFSVTSADGAGNSATDANGGAYFTFTTLGKSYALAFDNVEGGVGNWTASGGGTSIWHRDTCKAHSPTYAWKAGVTTCPGTYAASIDTYLTYNTNITLGAAGHGYHLKFWEYYQTESGFDYCRVQISTDGGTGWADILPQYAGAGTTWAQRDLDLSAYAGNQVRIRFWFHSDTTQNYEGWYVDDIEISKAAGCSADVLYASHTFTDPCNGTGSGGNNGILEPGEDAVITIAAVNSGMSNASNVVGTLSTSTPGVTVTDNSATFPNMTANGGTGSSQAPHFTVHVDSAVTCVTTVNFNLHTASTENPSGSDSQFTMAVGQAGGAVTVFSENFAGATPTALPAGWTTSSTSGNNWETNATGCTNNALMYRYNVSAAANSWAYTPGMTLTAGVTYTLDFNQKVYSASYPEIFEVKAGSAATPAGQTITIRPSASYTNTTCTARTNTFTVPTTGTYYIGWHCTSAANMWNLYVDDIAVTYPSTPVCNVCAASAPNVQYDATYNPVTSLAQVCGDNDPVVEPGEDWQVTVRLKNTGASQATNTVATLAVNAGSAVSATIQSGNPGAYGTIAAGGTAMADFVFRVDGGAACVNAITFDLISISSTEQSYADQTAAFAVQVGADFPGGNETRTQQTTPLNATSGAADSDFGPAAFTLAAADTATLSYTSGYVVGGAQTLIIQPSSADTYIAENQATTNYGTDATMIVRSRSTNRDARVLVQFDLSGIPPGATITGATLELYATNGGTNRTYDAHRVTEAWNETAVTWNTAPAFNAAADASAATGTTTNAWKTWTVTGLVQDWFAGTYANHGVLLKDRNEEGSNIAWTFASNNNGTTANHPILRINYTLPGGSWTASAQVSLVDPFSTVTVLKGYGVADANPYNVQPYYTGPGTYRIRLEENGGGTATVTLGSMNAVMNATSECDIASCGSPALPGEVPNTSFRWTSATALQWDAAANATGYTVYRGVPADLPKLLTDEGAGIYDSCPRVSVAGTGATGLNDAPAAGSFFWYLVAGTNPQGTGPLGNATGPVARILDPTPGVCP